MFAMLTTLKHGCRCLSADFEELREVKTKVFEVAKDQVRKHLNFVSMTDNNKKSRNNVDDFDFAHEGVTNETPMLVNCFVTRIQQAMANNLILQGEVQQQLHTYGVLPTAQGERMPEKSPREGSTKGLSTMREVENHYQELQQLLVEDAPPSNKRGHASHEDPPPMERNRSESPDTSMEDVAPGRQRAQRSPTPPMRKRSPHSTSCHESKREKKNSRKKNEKKGSLSYYLLLLSMKATAIPSWNPKEEHIGNPMPHGKGPISLRSVKREERTSLSSPMMVPLELVERQEWRRRVKTVQRKDQESQQTRRGDCKGGGLAASTELQLSGFTDADWAGGVCDRRSTSGFMFSLGSAAITWSSKKQPTVALSSTKAEYIGATMAACEVAWLELLLGDLGIQVQRPVFIHCDNLSGIQLARNPAFHARTRHIKVHYHFIRQRVLDGSIDLTFVRTNEHVATSSRRPLEQRSCDDFK
ncbi:hypothetical protein L7F22_047650 [Adiantum nelumboides]|nr:hypothetical protein [Adiantum nelumboides]